RSSLGNWRIGIGIPVELVQAGAKSAAVLLSLGVLAAIATALVLAYLIGKRIVDPMTTLASLARNVGAERSTIALPATGVREVEAVGRALEEADVAVRERHLLDQR